MAIAFRSLSASAGATVSTITQNKPTGVVSGDVMLAWIYVDTNGTISAAPSGWTQLDSQASATTGQTYNMYVYYKVAGASEPTSYSWTASSPQYCEIALVAFSGVDTTTPIDAHGIRDAGSTASLVTPTITTSAANDCLVALLVCWNGNGGASAQNSYTLPTNGAFSGNDEWLEYKLNASTGSNGNQTFTCSTAGGSVAALVALKPAGAGGSSLNQTVSDSHSGLDILAKNATKRLSGDTHSALDSLLKQWNHPIGEGTSGLDVLLKAVQKAAIKENTSATDAWQVMRGALISVLDKFSENDSLTRSFAKSPADAHSGQDATLKSVTHLLSDAISQVDTLAKLPAKRFIDLFSEVDSATATKQAGGVAWSRNITDAHSALDLIVRNASKLTADQWSSIDAVTHIWVAHLLITEVFSSAETLAKQVTHQTADSESSRDTAQTMRGALLTIVDALSEQDVQQKLMQHVLSESYSAQDTTLKLVRHAVADTLSETDKVTAGRSLLLTILEAISQQDGVQPSLLTSSGRKTLAMVTSLIAASLNISIVLLSPPLGSTVSASTALSSTGTILPPQLGAATSATGLLSSTASII